MIFSRKEKKGRWEVRLETKYCSERDENHKFDCSWTLIDTRYTEKVCGDGFCTARDGWQAEFLSLAEAKEKARDIENKEAGTKVRRVKL